MKLSLLRLEKVISHFHFCWLKLIRLVQNFFFWSRRRGFWKYFSSESTEWQNEWTALLSLIDGRIDRESEWDGMSALGRTACMSWVRRNWKELHWMDLLCVGTNYPAFSTTWLPDASTWAKSVCPRTTQSSLQRTHALFIPLNQHLHGNRPIHLAGESMEKNSNVFFGLLA